MLNDKKITVSLGNQLWPEASQTAAVLQNNLVSQQGAMNSHDTNLLEREELKDLVNSVLPTVML